MKKFLLLLMLFCVQLASAQITNINISQSVFFDGEPFLAVNPTNPQNMVIAWMGLTLTPTVRISIKSKVSFDGGATWGSYYTQPHLSNNTTSADVSMCFRNDGRLYISYIDSRQSPDSGVIYVANSTDGGVSWSTPTEAWNLLEDTAEIPLDRPWMVCDNSATSNYGMLYMTTKPVPWEPAPNRPYFKSSTDGGLTWSSPRFVDTTNYLVGSLIEAPMAAVTTTADGAVCAAYPSFLFSQATVPKIYLAKSYDRGNHFDYSTVLSNPVSAGDTNLKLGYCFVADESDATRMAIAYTGGQNGDADIFVVSTNDGGESWSLPVRVNDDALSNGKHQDMAWASYSSAGRLMVTWRDRRNGTGTGFQQPSDTYASLSLDNGASFTRNFRLSTVTTPFDSVLFQDGNDFMCCQLVGDSICTAWGDVRTGKLNIFFAKASDSTGILSNVIQVASEDLFDINVYPNPSKDFVTVDLPNAEGTLTLTDVDAKVIWEKRNASVKETVDCRTLSAGNYFVKFISGNFVLKKPLQVQR
jgi:hypothetical protein